MTNSECPAFPFSHRPGIAMDPDYLKEMRIQPLIPVRLQNGNPAQLVTDHVGPAVLLAGIGIEVAVGYRRLSTVRLRQVETDRFDEEVR